MTLRGKHNEKDAKPVTNTPPRMTLSAMENAVGNVNAHAKLQNLLGQAGEEESQEVKNDDLLMEEQMYRIERLNRKIYTDVDLHVTFIELITLLVTLSLLSSPLLFSSPPCALRLTFSCR